MATGHGDEPRPTPRLGLGQLGEQRSPSSKGAECLSGGGIKAGRAVWGWTHVCLGVHNVFVCTQVYANGFVCKRGYVCMHVPVCASTDICIYTYTCKHIHACAHRHVCTSACVHTHRQTIPTPTPLQVKFITQAGLSTGPHHAGLEQDPLGHGLRCTRVCTELPRAPGTVCQGLVLPSLPA